MSNNVYIQILGAIRGNPKITADELMKLIKKYDPCRMPKTEVGMRVFRQELIRVLRGGGQRWATTNPHIAIVAHAVRSERIRKKVDAMM